MAWSVIAASLSSSEGQPVPFFYVYAKRPTRPAVTMLGIYAFSGWRECGSSRTGRAVHLVTACR
jgi:hypothetical protein